MTTASYRELQLAAMASSRVSEGTSSLPIHEPRPSEADLQSRWFAGEFGREFVTTTGQRVEIVQIGIWNHAAGPDFSQVAVRIGGRLLSGFLELDWDVRDWERHGHAENPGYEDVILHVFFTQPAGSAFFTRTPRHREVAQVQIDLAAFSFVGAPGPPAEAKCGRCSFPLRDLPAAGVVSLFEAAARQRLETKALRLSRLARLHGWDQALFQELAAAMGYRHNQQAMTMLVQRLPLSVLSSHAAGPEALLFGAAGFLETRTYEKAPLASREYLRGLWEMWWKYRGEFCAVEPPRWVMAGARPQNHPHRRLGALAEIVRHWKKIRAAFDLPLSGDGGPVSALVSALESMQHAHWDHHYTLASVRSAPVLKLIGATRTQEILANLVFPYLSLRADLMADWWPVYAALPAVLENEKSRRAAVRLLGRRPDRAALQDKLFHQQALLQIYQDFCLQDHSDCAQCLFPEQLSRWPLTHGGAG